MHLAAHLQALQVLAVLCLRRAWHSRTAADAAAANQHAIVAPLTHPLTQWLHSFSTTLLL